MVLDKNGTQNSINRGENKTPIIPVIFEDNHLLVIDKPAGISVHPAPGEKEQTAIEILGEKRNVYLVHRLDKPTSGIMIFAKTEKDQAFLQNLFKSRKIKKTYLALVRGRLEPSEGIIDLPLGRGISERNKISPKEKGKSAKTTYKVIKQTNKYTYLKVNPETGRTHQIRVHLSSLGFPILGDRRYGGEDSSAERMFLHAEEIELIHPETKKRVKYLAALPEELQERLTVLLS